MTFEEVRSGEVERGSAGDGNDKPMFSSQNLFPEGRRDQVSVMRFASIQ